MFKKDDSYHLCSHPLPHTPPQKKKKGESLQNRMDLQIENDLNILNNV